MRGRLMKKCTAMFAVFILLFGMHTVTYSNTEHWAGPVLEKWVDNNLLTGDTSGDLMPDAMISKAETATVLNRLFQYVESSDDLKDVMIGQWYTEAMSKAIAASIFEGNNQGNIFPENNITRQEMAVIIQRAFELTGETDYSSLFSDDAYIDDWAREAVYVLKDQGIMEGKPGNIFEPDSMITRAEFIVVLDRLIGEIIDEPGTYDGEIEGHLIVNCPDVNLSQMTISGNLYIAEGVSEGEILLDGVTVNGDTIIKGGGENSVVIRNSNLKGKTIILKINGRIRVFADEGSTIEEVLLKSGAKLENSSGEGGFGKIEVAVLLPGQSIELEGDYEALSISAPDVQVDVLNGAVQKVLIQHEAEGVTLNVSKDARVGEMDIKAPAKVTGDGKIQEMTVEVDGVVIDNEPENMEVKAGVTTTVGGETVSGEKEQEEESGNQGNSNQGSTTKTYSTGDRINFSKDYLQVGVVTQMTASTTENGNINWDSSDDSVAKINEDTGVITAISAGTATISYKTDGYKKNSKKITVHAGPSVLNPTYGLVQVTYGDVSPSGHATPNTGETITWTISDSTRASIDITNGTLSPLQEGSVIVSYVIVDDATGLHKAKGITNVNILGENSGDPIMGIGTISTILQMGETVIRTASTNNAGSESWASSNTLVATIHPNSGLVTALTPGQTTISYTSSTGNSKIDIQVYDMATIDNPSYEPVHMGWGDVMPTGHTTAGAGQTISWLSSNEAVASVNQTSGSVSPVSLGDTTISYSLTDDTTGQILTKGSAIITVLPELNGDSITGIGTKASVLQIGETTARTASTTEGGILTWESSDESIASIDQSGNVTAISSGQVIISYRSDNGKRYKKTISVFEQASVNDPVIDDTLYENGPTVTTSAYTQPLAGESIVWTSDDESVLLVNASSGLLTPKASGSANINYQVTNDTSGEVIARGSIEANILAEAGDITSLSLAPGTEDGTTQISAITENNMNRIVYKVQADAFSTILYVGEDLSGTYTTTSIGANISVLEGEHLILIALDDNDQILALTDHTMVRNEIYTTTNLYISEYTNNLIHVFGIVGSADSNLVTNIDAENYSGPLAIDVTNTYIYWAEQDGQYIGRSNIDGTSEVELFDTGCNNIGDILVDEANSKLYWSDYTTDVIWQSDLDGSNPVDIVTNAGRAISIQLYNDSIYYIGDETGYLYKMNLDGTNKESSLVQVFNPYEGSDFCIDTSGNIYVAVDNDVHIYNGTSLIKTNQMFITGDGGLGGSISQISIYNNILYYGATSNGTIRSVHVDGTNNQLVYTPTSPTAITGLEVE